MKENESEKEKIREEEEKEKDNQKETGQEKEQQREKEKENETTKQNEKEYEQWTDTSIEEKINELEDINYKEKETNKKEEETERQNEQGKIESKEEEREKAEEKEKEKIENEKEEREKVEEKEKEKNENKEKMEEKEKEKIENKEEEKEKAEGKENEKENTTEMLTEIEKEKQKEEQNEREKEKEYEAKESNNKNENEIHENEEEITSNEISSIVVESTNIQINYSTNIPTTIININPTTIPIITPTTVPNIIPTTIPNIVKTTIPNIIQTTVPNIIPTTAPNIIPTTVPNIIPTTVPTNGSGNYEYEDEVSGKDKSTAEQIASITLSFMQLTNFLQSDDYKNITFDFYAITTEKNAYKDDNIILSVNLIHTNGTKENDLTEADCEPEKELLNNIGSAQVHFICCIELLIPKKYYSFRFNSSLNVSSIPTDEVALDPVLTKKAIDKKQTTDYSTNNKIPPTFIPKSFNYDSCPDKGILIITGDLSEYDTEKIKDISLPIKFTIPVTYPDAITLSCILNKDKINIVCKLDREVKSNTIIVEQYIVKKGNEEILIIGNFETDKPIKCNNAILEESKQKTEITVSFRQVSNYKSSENKITFYLITLLSKSYKKGEQLNLLMDMKNKNIEIEKNAICTLESNVSPKGGSQSQGNWFCSLDLTNSGYKSTDFDTITVSPENNEISGVSDLDEITSSPQKTDQAIKEINERKAKHESINDLTNIIDYYKNEKENIIPPTFEPSSIYANNCKNSGKIYLEGKFSDKIDEEMKFDLPLTYPNAEVKCQLYEANKNEIVNMTCKVQSKFDSVDYFIIEPKLIKKKNQEMFFINGKELSLGKEISCENYNIKKVEIAEKKQNTKISFLQLGKFQSIRNILKFFIALTKPQDSSISFNNEYKLPVKIKLSNKRLLRNLDETKSGVEVSCKLNETLKTDFAAGYDCINNDIKGTPTNMETETDEITDIAGIPDNANPSYLKNTLDYSKISNLNKIQNLPIITIESINGDTCSENGQYNISGKIQGKEEYIKKAYSNIEIRFSSPESSGLCQGVVNNSEINITCENKEKFDTNQILLDRHVIQDYKGNNVLIINNYQNPEQFACAISLNSILPNETRFTRSSVYRKNNKGLRGGAIAAIVICSVFTLAAVAIIFALGKKGYLANKKQPNIAHISTSIYNNSSVQQIDHDNIDEEA